MFVFFIEFFISFPNLLLSSGNTNG